MGSIRNPVQFGWKDVWKIQCFIIGIINRPLLRTTNESFEDRGLCQQLHFIPEICRTQDRADGFTRGAIGSSEIGLEKTRYAGGRIEKIILYLLKLFVGAIAEEHNPGGCRWQIDVTDVWWKADGWRSNGDDAFASGELIQGLSQDMAAEAMTYDNVMVELIVIDDREDRFFQCRQGIVRHRIFRMVGIAEAEKFKCHEIELIGQRAVELFFPGLAGTGIAMDKYYWSSRGRAGGLGGKGVLAEGDVGGFHRFGF